jgi:GMP synthase (glutamine-hydrolysing)
MRIHYLQHVPFEGPGCIVPWAGNQGHTLTATALFTGEPLPDLSTFDLLIILGGPMGVHDTVEHPWLPREKRFITQSLAMNKRVLGICLGAQLMADALGAKVYPNAHKEIGWFRVRKAATASGTPLDAMFPPDFFAFHWHGDTFDLPEGAVNLAESEVCRHQAFFYPPAALGLQFHLESTKESIAALIQHCGQELQAAPYIQSKEEIISGRQHISPSNKSMYSILNFIQGCH